MSVFSLLRSVFFLRRILSHVETPLEMTADWKRCSVLILFCSVLFCSSCSVMLCFVSFCPAVSRACGAVPVCVLVCFVMAPGVRHDGFSHGGVCGGAAEPSLRVRG